MRRFARGTLAALLLALGLAGASGPASATCPTNTLSGQWLPAVSWTLASKDTVVSAEGLYAPWAHMRYSWPTDSVYVRFGGGMGPYDARFEGHEQFTIVGPPPGTSTVCTIDLRLSGSASPAWEDIPTHAYGSAALLLNGGSLGFAQHQVSCGNYTCTSSGTLNTTLSTTQVIVVGEPFDLGVLFRGSGGGGVLLDVGSVTVSGRFLFSTVTPGCVVVSCHGDSRPATTVVGVGPDPASGLTIHLARPNPSPGPVEVTFSTPRAGPAALQLIDLAGRECDVVKWSALPAGRHVETLQRRGVLPPGEYILRLTQGGESTARVVTLLR